MSIVVQVQERRVTLNLPNGERTTASEVVTELHEGELKDELTGKHLKLIFSGRVIDPRELITAVVPFGAVVQCAIQSERDVASRLEEGEQDDESFEDDEVDNGHITGRSILVSPGGSLAARRRIRETRLDYSDFVWGFMLGFVVGPLMCFWLLEPAPKLQKLGICMGCAIRTLTYEYRQMIAMTSFSLGRGGGEGSGIPHETNSFDIVVEPSGPA